MIIPKGESKEFLGKEFLTWLWYYGEINDWKMDFPDKTSVSYGMDEVLVLADDGSSQRLSGDLPTRTPEAKAGLLEGKKVKTVRVIFVEKEREWTVTLHDNFSFSSLILNDTKSKDKDDQFFDIAYDLENFCDLFDKIYHYFLESRLSSDWKKSEEFISLWVKK